MEATTKEISQTMQMGEILDLYPSAKRALFQKYHIGGCQSCGYSMDQTLEEVLVNHNRPDELSNAIEEIYTSARVDEEMQITPEELKKQIDEGVEWKLLDVREDFEVEIAALEGSEILTRELAYEIMQSWDKNTNMVFICHHGIRSLEAANYFKGHNLPNVKSLKGGIDRWSLEVDPDIARY